MANKTTYQIHIHPHGRTFEELSHILHTGNKLLAYNLDLITESDKDNISYFTNDKGIYTALIDAVDRSGVP